MFAAQLKQKLTREEENLEDLLTSNVFGVFEYSPVQQGLIPFLTTARNLAGQPIANLNKIRTAEYLFWPWIHEGCYKGCEPDLLIRAILEDDSIMLILIESKYFSGKSNSTDETIWPKDQLAREMLNLRGLASKENTGPNPNNYILVYVAPLENLWVIFDS